MSSQPPYHEKELLERLALQDKPAFTYFYELFYKGLFFYACRFVDAPVAEDLLADLFIKLYQSGKVFLGPDHVQNWLRLSLHNACLNAIRDQRLQEEKQTQLAVSMPLFSDFTDAEIEAEVYTLILEALYTLPPQQQKILCLAFIEGMDNAAIAEALGIAHKSVKNQKSIALQALRRSFTKTELLGLAAILGTQFLSR